MRTDGKGFRQDQDWARRQHEYTGIGRVPDHQILLQDGFRHGGDSQGGSRICGAAQVLYFPVERRKGTSVV